MAKTQDDYLRLRNRILLALAISYGICFLFFFGYALFTFPEKAFLRPFRVQWTFAQSTINFINSLLAVQCAAILATCAFTAPPVPSLKVSHSEGFSRLVSSTVVILILLSLVFVVLSEGLRPGLSRKLAHMEYRTTILRNYLDLATASRKAGNLAQSEAYLEYYLSVYRDDPSAISLQSAVRRQAAELTDTAEDSQQRLPTRPVSVVPADLINRARRAADNEDYYTAYYYADLVSDMTQPASVEWQAGKEILEAIQEHLSVFSQDKAELERKGLFEVKTKGLIDLSSEDPSQIIRAYYTFLTLSIEHPDDPEVKTYLNRSIETLSTSVFFLQEVENIVSMPGLHDLFFINSPPDSQRTQLLSIGKIIRTETGTYAQDVEALTITQDGTVVCHMQASVGKIMTGSGDRSAIYLTGIDRYDSARYVEPVYLTRADDTACEEVLTLRPASHELETIYALREDLSLLSIFQLREMWDVSASYGYSDMHVKAEAISRLAPLFGFLILSLGALGLGWRLGPVNGMPPPMGMLLIPALPFLAHTVIEVYLYLHNIFIGATVMTWGFAPSLIILLALDFILLAITIVVLAGQSLKKT